MSSTWPQLLHQIAATLHVIVAFGHVGMGFTTVYPALAKVPETEFKNKSGRLGARLCWDLTTTILVSLALFHLKWARLGPFASQEETFAFVGVSLHLWANGLQYLRIGEIPAGPVLLLSSTVGLGAIVADYLM